MILFNLSNEKLVAFFQSSCCRSGSLIGATFETIWLMEADWALNMMLLLPIGVAVLSLSLMLAQFGLHSVQEGHVAVYYRFVCECYYPIFLFLFSHKFQRRCPVAHREWSRLPYNGSFHNYISANPGAKKFQKMSLIWKDITL